MQIELLETFLDLMETNSFNRTAERLNVSQSTVSNRIQSLELAIGAQVFTRSRAGTRPTAAGQRFVDHARNLLHEWNQAARAARSAHDFDMSMRVGMQHDLAASHLGEWLAEFRQAMPKTSFYVELDYSVQMASELSSGVLDAALLFTPRNLPDLHYEQVGEIEYRLVSADTASLEGIRADRYIFANYSPAFDRMHREIIGGVVGNASVSSGQNIAVCELVTALGGSAFVKNESAIELVATGRFRMVQDTPPIRQAVYFGVHLRNRHMRAHRRLLEIVKRRFAMQGPATMVPANAPSTAL